MPFRGFEGAAGTGKTHSLIEAVRERLAASPMLGHQRVLALTFMHGSRRRLDERFAGDPQLRGRYSCLTIDGFAAHIAQRWSGLAAAINATRGDFTQTCDSCGRLLEEVTVAKWVAASFPVCVVDEAQELGLERLRVVKAMTGHVNLLVAADEFQCLDQRIDTRPFAAWFQTGRITVLDQVRRTDQRGLLDAATALRNGTEVTDGPGLRVRYEFPNQMPFAIGHAINGARANGGDVALVVAPGSKPWADELIARLSQGFSSARQTVAAMRIGWESRSEDEVTRTLALFDGLDAVNATDAMQRLSGLADAPRWVRSCVDAIAYQQRACGQELWSRPALEELLGRKAAFHRAYGRHHSNAVRVLTIQGAKNRQFRHVIVLWGPGVPGSDEHQRRLLYNAITRSEMSCNVFVRTQALLAQPPFKPR